ncbi:MAG: hypothetical protein NZ455_06855 [Bacteroidia bacterium]|nr:hypothetical protein [Bacteroidia bacterium]MDW8345548.1 hypothetical protein [Bacteroidia bacterium]
MNRRTFHDHFNPEYTSFTLVVMSLLAFKKIKLHYSVTYNVKISISGLNSIAACVRHAEGVRQHGAKPSPTLSLLSRGWAGGA